MTPEQKMNKLFETLGGLLHEKDEAISLREWQLKKANEEINALKEMNAELEKENALLEDALKEAETEIENLKGGGSYVD